MRQTPKILVLLLLFSVSALAQDATWEISRVFPDNGASLAEMPYPRFYAIKFGQWQPFTLENGEVNVLDQRSRLDGAAGLVMSRVVFESVKAESISLKLSFNDEIAVFLNKRKLFVSGSKTGEQKMSLDLDKGINELFIVSRDSEGEWKFSIELNKPLVAVKKAHSLMQPLWSTESVFTTPESATYDEKRKVLYVSNFDARFKAGLTDPEQFTQYLSKLDLDGNILEHKWIEQLNAPCGMDIFEDKLYVAERHGIAVIDLTQEKIVARYPIKDSVFLNDLVVDAQGAVYITDSRPDGRIYRIKDGAVEVWFQSDEIIQANGIYIKDGKLLVGNSGDGRLLAVDIRSKQISTAAALSAGVLDGIRYNSEGDFLISHWVGRVYLVKQSGEIFELANFSNEPFNTADFEFIESEKMLIVPTFLGNSVKSWKISQNN